MIVSCDGCQTKYLLGDDKVPENGIRVRCPKCQFVWRLTPPEQESIFQVTSNGFGEGAPHADAQQDGWAAMDSQARSMVMTEPVSPAATAEEVTISDEPPAPVESETIEDPQLRKKRERARRQARVFVSDILVYNQEKRDRGLRNGDLMSVLGPEIKKAWEAYKEKVGPDLPESSEFFRTALNEILADGQQIF